ncbi:MAG TPA: NADH:flavin oxidoreductase [Acidimicrobiales bacterium]|nr:NADH:flavin oxidoreductase [Acidimicrobiales bacterium]
MHNPFEQVAFAHGPAAKNRFMLSPLTNQQSHADGVLSDEEYRWLELRAEGGFGIVTTCAAHVQASGQGFAGQLGCFSDLHLEGLRRLAAGIKAFGALAYVQLHHAGMRSPSELTGLAPVAPFADAETGARELTTAEVEEVVQAFVAAALRCERAGFDGVELHGAHGYLLGQFLDRERNVRADRYGGSLENRSRVFFEILSGVRAHCGPDFQISVRLSPERFGMSTPEALELFRGLLDTGQVDLVDLSMWDVFKEPMDPDFAGRSLLELFSEVERGLTRLGAAGKLYSALDIRRALDAGLDLVVLGRAAVTNHDFPDRMRRDDDFHMRELPVSVEQLRAEGLSDPFIAYMRSWRGFVEE